MIKKRHNELLITLLPRVFCCILDPPMKSVSKVDISK